MFPLVSFLMVLVDIPGYASTDVSGDFIDLVNRPNPVIIFSLLSSALLTFILILFQLPIAMIIPGLYDHLEFSHLSSLPFDFYRADLRDGKIDFDSLLFPSLNSPLFTFLTNFLIILYCYLST